MLESVVEHTRDDGGHHKLTLMTAELEATSPLTCLLLFDILVFFW